MQLFSVSSGVTRIVLALQRLHSRVATQPRWASYELTSDIDRHKNATGAVSPPG